MNKEKEKQHLLMQDRQFLSKITLICIAVSVAYAVFYLFAGMKTAGLFNILIVAFYGLSLLISRYKLTEFNMYSALSIFTIQIFFFSYIFFPANTGYHLYFLVVPMMIILIKKHNNFFFKIIFSAIPLLLFFYCDFFSTRFSPLYELSDTLTRIIYISSVLTVISGMAVVLYFFKSEKEKLIRKLNDAKVYAESLFNFSPYAIYTVDTKERVIDFNNKAESLTGYTLEELKNKTVDFIAGNTLRDKDGKKKFLERSSSELYDENRNIIGRIVSFMDVTDKVELEEFKIGIERVIRHDLKTPLNTIIGFPDVMLEDPSVSEENKNYLHMIRNSGQNMLNMINQSQNLFRIENDSYDYTAQQVPVFFILKQITVDLEYLVHRKQSEIAIFYNGNHYDENRELYIDSEQTLMYMIFTNLIKNALEATPEGEKISISIDDNEGFSLSVHNKGEIPLEIRKNFFEKYITRGKKNGIGLGTYSAKIMSRAIGAELSFNSSLEMGTTLTFIIAG